MKFITKISLYYNTIIYLKSGQILWRVYYLLRKQFRKVIRHEKKCTSYHVSYHIALTSSIASYSSFKEGFFTFLNRTKQFGGKVDWTFNGFGKLWTYNLSYFEFLGQEKLEIHKARAIIDDFIAHARFDSVSFEPYPTSLRCVNWIKFFLKYRINNLEYNIFLYGQLQFLSRNIEYHLRGNHLLENAFSLLLGAYYFQDEKFYKKAFQILISELDEQILNDGGHFELSPMYHQIILYRLLDCINLINNSRWKNDNLGNILTNKAIKMLAWINNISFRNGDIPYVNDSTPNVSPSTQELNAYAIRLGLNRNSINLPLYESRYRVIRHKKYELFIDAGNIGPDYLLAHAHSDIFNFILHVKETPLIVDSAISTYEKNSRRQIERSTVSHNTVMVNGIEQNQMWDGFRVAKRAKIIAFNEGKTFIEAAHDGYKKSTLIHRRKYQYYDDIIIIEDSIESTRGNKETMLNKAYFHFHPSVELFLEENSVLASNTRISFSGYDRINIEGYLHADGYNLLSEAKMLSVTFNQSLKCKILV